jgi:hypothetical protein
MFMVIIYKYFSGETAFIRCVLCSFSCLELLQISGKLEKHTSDVVYSVVFHIYVCYR